jgi:hypothetical protein
MATAADDILVGRGVLVNAAVGRAAGEDEKEKGGSRYRATTPLRRHHRLLLLSQRCWRCQAGIEDSALAGLDPAIHLVERARPKNWMTGIWPPAGAIMTAPDAGRGKKIRRENA